VNETPPEAVDEANEGLEQVIAEFRASHPDEGL
jgi:hypothetical protein